MAVRNNITDEDIFAFCRVMVRVFIVIALLQVVAIYLFGKFHGGAQ